MFSDERAVLRRVVVAGQFFAQAVILVATLNLVAATLFVAPGWTSWPEIALSLSGEPVERAGMWLQIGLPGLMAALVFWLPANTRMESRHRRLAMGASNVARACRMSHEADYSGLFGLSSEFDSIRTLAQTCSDENVARAKGFVQQRQEEIDALNERLRLARGICDEMHRLLAAIEAERNQTRIQLRRLEDDLREILPVLGYALDIEERNEAEGNLVALSKAPPALRPAPRT